MFKLDWIESPEGLAERVQYLLEDDRFLCPEENYEVRMLEKIRMMLQRLMEFSELPTSFFGTGYCGYHV